MGTIASERVPLLMSFRGRLLILLTSFLLLTTVLVVLLDGWAQKRVNTDVQNQNERVKQIVACLPRNSERQRSHRS
jgi:hypothetical protein